MRWIRRAVFTGLLSWGWRNRTKIANTVTGKGGSRQAGGRTR